MNRKKLRNLGMFGLVAGILLFGQIAMADIKIPAIPPTDQIQQPARGQHVPGVATPVAMQVHTAPNIAPEQSEWAKKTGERIKVMLDTILQGSTTVVVVSEKIDTPEPLSPGMAKNIITTPVSAEKKVIAVITKTVAKKKFIPFKLSVEDGKGKVLGSKKFKYQKDKEQGLAEDLTAFLEKFIAFTPVPMVNDGAEQVARPVLRTWIESSDGKDIRIGSKIALYYSSDTNGYVSAYHFGSSGMVQRLYPNNLELYNFIEAGKVYRFPAAGFLTMSGPAGRETIKLVLTKLPSNTPRDQGNGISLKIDPLHIIPTHYPVLFSDGPMNRFFALPEEMYTETHINYTLQSK